MHTLAVSHVSKHFTRKKALDDVSLVFETGRVYALLGENGAGKSTLASLLSGDAEQTSGSIMLDDMPAAFRSPRDAIDSGIAMVRQQPLLADELTVWENCILGNEKTGAAGFLKKRETLAELSTLESGWNFSVKLEQKAGALSAPERLFGTLLANLYKKPRFLILDEPSATLDEEQRIRLFRTITDKAHQTDMCIIFITHNIQEALDYADYITILQKGHVVFSENITQHKPTVSDVADMLFARKEGAFSFSGGTSSQLAAAESASSGHAGKAAAAPVLELQDVTVRPDEGAALFNISFTVPKGQLTCISGQRESGMDTLENLLTGMADMTGAHFASGSHIAMTGTICFEGECFKKPLSPRFLRNHGTAIIPFRKMIRASHPELTIAELLGSTGANAQTILEQVQTDITLQEKVKALSGGMLQRLIVARELWNSPDFVIMSSPSYGLDRFSTGKITETVESLLSRGATVLVLGEESALTPLCTNRYQLVSGRIAPVNATKEEQ